MAQISQVLLFACKLSPFYLYNFGSIPTASPEWLPSKKRCRAFIKSTTYGNEDECQCMNHPNKHCTQPLTPLIEKASIRADGVCGGIEGRQSWIGLLIFPYL